MASLSDGVDNLADLLIVEQEIDDCATSMLSTRGRAKLARHHEPAGLHIGQIRLPSHDEAGRM